MRDDVDSGPFLGPTHSRSLGCTSGGRASGEAECIMTDQSQGDGRDAAGCAVCGQREPTAMAMVNVCTRDRALGE